MILHNLFVFFKNELSKEKSAATQVVISGRTIGVLKERTMLNAKMIEQQPTPENQHTLELWIACWMKLRTGLGW